MHAVGVGGVSRHAPCSVVFVKALRCHLKDGQMWPHVAEALGGRK
jgi:hypothetical protein